MGKKGEGGQKVQNSSCKISQSWGFNVQHGDSTVLREILKVLLIRKINFITMYGFRCSLDLLCDYFTIFTNIKSSCGTPEINTLYFHYILNLKKKKKAFLRM